MVESFSYTVNDISLNVCKPILSIHKNWNLQKRPNFRRNNVDDNFKCMNTVTVTIGHKTNDSFTLCKMHSAQMQLSSWIVESRRHTSFYIQYFMDQFTRTYSHMQQKLLDIELQSKLQLHQLQHLLIDSADDVKLSAGTRRLPFIPLMKKRRRKPSAKKEISPLFFLFYFI